MTKVNVAQYIMHDLLNRFPLNNEIMVDEDIIETLIDRWSKNKYITPDRSIRTHHAQAHNQRYLV
jgi:hypothetical protein